MPGPCSACAIHRFWVIQIGLQLRKVVSGSLSQIFNCLFLKVFSNHFSAFPPLRLCFHASGEMKRLQFVKLLAVLIVNKSFSKVRLCSKQVKQDLARDLKHLEANKSVMHNHLKYYSTQFALSAPSLCEVKSKPSSVV